MGRLRFKSSEMCIRRSVGQSFKNVSRKFFKNLNLSSTKINYRRYSKEFKHCCACFLCLLFAKEAQKN